MPGSLMEQTVLSLTVSIRKVFSCVCTSNFDCLHVFHELLCSNYLIFK